MKFKKPMVLLIRDGWGIGDGGPGDGTALAKTPNMDRIKAKYPRCTLEASGEGVGVRAGSQGSSEVGHLNMGAGRIVAQEVVRIDQTIRDGSFFSLPRLKAAADNCRKKGSKLHLMGLVQDQGVHATDEHLFALLEFAKKENLSNVCIHFFSDGRDTPPRSAQTYLDRLEAKMKEIGVGRVASVIGRYWAMDRAENWGRVEKAYRALTLGEGLKAASAKEAIDAAYARADAQIAAGKEKEGTPPESDEFIQPTLMVDASGRPTGIIEAGDSVIHFNYRQDRAIQLANAFVLDSFTNFNRGAKLDIHFSGMTRYYDEFTFELIPPMNMANLLGEVLSVAKLWQLRIAEYQKYRHVTSFFNGKLIEAYPMEDRVQVESITIPENQKPEMSAYEVTELVLEAVTGGIGAIRAKAPTMKGVEGQFDTKSAIDANRLKDTYDVIVLNYANGDMVGHTGDLAAATKAIEVVDECMGKVIDAVLAKDGVVIVTADHGNAEQMIDPKTGKPQTSHTLSDVDCVLVGNDTAGVKMVKRGVLADIAVTMLELLQMPIPKEMTAKSLLAK